MAIGLAFGMQLGRGPFTGGAAVLANAALLVQFPFVHSFLLSKRGGRLLAGLLPFGRIAHGGGRELTFGQVLAPTLFALSAALQIGAVFVLWSPLDGAFWQPTGSPMSAAWWPHWIAFAFAWLVLVRALTDAGLGLQTGWNGWTALWRGQAPRYPGMPVRGLFRRSRQPIYLGFALVLWTGPVWTLDHLAIASAWTSYCVLGPLLKERRFGARYGADFTAYRERVPYFLPKLLP